MLKKTLRNENGFTLIEIIAVLVILGILAAVAVPKYMDMQVEAKRKAAMGQVAEFKGSLSSAWGKGFLGKGSAPTAEEARANADLTTGSDYIGTAPDRWGYTLQAIGTTGWNIQVTSRDGDGQYVANGAWYVP